MITNLPLIECGTLNMETGIEHKHFVAMPQVIKLVYNEGDNVCGKMDIRENSVAFRKNHIF